MYDGWLHEFVANRFQLVAGHLALDFANTLDYRFDVNRRVDLLRDYTRLVEFARQSQIITRRQAKRLLQTTSADRTAALRRGIRLREALDSLFRSVVSGKSPRRSCLQTLNRLLASTRPRYAVSCQGSEFIRVSNFVSKPDAPLGFIGEAAASLLTSPDCRYIRECADSSCRWLFLDHSKNHSRRWCDMKICGNRSKVRRFRARS
jgi:predicted RNA-binding Zn ribbon-like protein